MGSYGAVLAAGQQISLTRSDAWVGTSEYAVYRHEEKHGIGTLAQVNPGTHLIEMEMGK